LKRFLNRWVTHAIMALSRSGLRGVAFVAVAACGFLFTADNAEPQTRGGERASRPVKAAAEVWRDCERAHEPAHLEAIAAAKSLLGRLWLATERGFFAAYTMEGEKRKPFDLSPKAPDSGPRDGIVQARAPSCTWRSGEAPTAILVRFTTPFYRFHEAGPGWSQPLRGGLMLEAVVERAGDTWQARDVGGEKSILLAEQKPRPADARALPAETVWAEPIPGCARKTKWNGEACVPRKR
jgi:hypothetical protein